MIYGAGGDGLKVNMKGAPGETVHLTALKPAPSGADWIVVRKGVVVGADGAASATFR